MRTLFTTNQPTASLTEQSEQDNRGIFLVGLLESVFRVGVVVTYSPAPIRLDLFSEISLYLKLAEHKFSQSQQNLFL